METTPTPATPAQIQQLIVDATDFAVKTVLIALPKDTASIQTYAADIKAAVDNAVANNTTAPDPAQTVVAGLKVAVDSCNLAGKTTIAADIQEGEDLVVNFESNGGHPVLAGIKTFFQDIKTLFAKK